MYSFLFLLLFPLLAIADERPVIPQPGEDLTLTGGKSAKEFFEARKQNTECRKKWEAAFLEHRKAQTELYKMVAEKSPAKIADKKEAEVQKIRTRLLDLTDICGPCATQDVGKSTVVTPVQTEYWYISDGSCYLPTAADSLESFNKVINFVTNTRTYARQRGGFDSVLEFVPIDKTTGAVLPHDEHVVIGSVLNAYIAVRGKYGMAFNYTFENIGEVREKNGKKEFILRFNGFERPENFVMDVFDTTLSGTKHSLFFNKNITRVLGMWYFNTDGYYRYYTAADFESSIFSLGDATAKRTLLDSVLSLAERGL